MNIMGEKKNENNRPKSLPLVSVKPYKRGNTIVKPYIRTNKDGYVFNNMRLRSSNYDF